MRSILFLVLLLIAGWVGYTYFFGKGDDKARAENIVSETRELGRSVGDFLHRQKEKYDDGEFNRLIDKINAGIQKLKKKTPEEKTESKEELKELETELRKIDPDKL
ncbi:MAG: hypothetical protein M3R25_10920, partial [Bacteroidota bacterium]|nr:hypothetical protein [Bacteroidota bacterium]